MGQVSDDQRAPIIDDHKCGEELKVNFIIRKTRRTDSEESRRSRGSANVIRKGEYY
jgi:hypothetical protein